MKVISQSVFTKNVKPLFPTRDEFFKSCQPQTFALPKSIMEYIWKNPKSPETYQRVAMSCKLAFLKNPISVIPTFHYSKENGCEFCYGCEKCLEDHSNNFCMNKKKIDLKVVKSRLWIITRLDLNGIDKSKVDLLVSKIYQAHVFRFDVHHQEISYDVVLFFGLHASEVVFSSTSVKYKDDSYVPLEEIFKIFQNAQTVKL